MRYKFTDTTGDPKYDFGLVTKYGSTILDEIEGVTSLSVRGRGNASRSFQTISRADSDREYLISSRLNPVNLEVKLLLEAKDDYAMRDLGDRLNLIFLQHPDRLQFSDDSYYYLASLESIGYEEMANQTVAILRFRSDFPYKFQDVEGSGSIFRWRSYLPVVPDEIVCAAQASAPSFSLLNTRTGQSIRLSRSVSAGQVIKIQPGKYFGITVNGQNAMPDLVPASEFERFELQFMDELICTPTSSITMKARIVKLG